MRIMGQVSPHICLIYAVSAFVVLAALPHDSAIIKVFSDGATMLDVIHDPFRVHHDVVLAKNVDLPRSTYENCKGKTVIT